MASGRVPKINRARSLFKNLVSQVRGNALGETLNMYFTGLAVYF